MTAKSIANRTKAVRAEAALPQHEIFALNGKYQVAPSTTNNDLHNDIGCWLDSIQGTIGVLIDSCQGDADIEQRDIARMLRGVQYLLEMVDNGLLASYRLGSAGGGT